MNIKRILSIIFGMLAILGAAYIFYTGGSASAGYAVVPGVISLLFSQRSRKSKTSINKKVNP